MKKQFNITGLFYTKDEYKFRKFLHIKMKTSTKKNPDLMVIMMNPGSSKPVNGNENSTEETETIPDNTQSQVMRVMLSCGFEFARILNLSDLRESKSNELYKKMEILKEKQIPHSIFDDKRKNDFKKMFIKGIPVIFAWGVSKNLEELANMAIKRVQISNPIGWQKEGFDYAYYHPLPQNYNKQKEWVERITDMIK